MPRRKKIEEKKPVKRARKAVRGKKEPQKDEKSGNQAESDYLVDLRTEKAEEPLSEIEYAEKLEKEKRIVMWSGVAFLMLAIIIIWFLNIRNVFRAIPQSNAGDSLDWKEITDNFSKSMDEAKSSFEEIRKLPEQAATSSPAVLPDDDSASGIPSGGEKNSAAISPTDVSDPAEQADLSELKKKIDELEKKLQANQ
jgi:hypothetical protein